MASNENSKGRLLIISAPSGAGKGTLIKRLVERMENIWVSVSATTRSPRPGEIDGVDYFFLTRERFEQLIAEDGFLEYAEYNGNYYGTPIFPIMQHIDAGDIVVLEIEVQGAFQVKERVPDCAMLFIEPPSMEELERRLRARGTEADEVILGRLRTAQVELGRKMEYDMRLVNDDLEKATDELLDYVRGLSSASE